jgi:hypothetical protein
MPSVQEYLREACEEMGNDDFASFRNDYSGRGMHGRQCVGIVGTMAECQLIMAQAIKNMSMALSAVAMESINPDYSATEDDLADTENYFDMCINQLMNFSMDNMGRGTILYWPELEPIFEENQEIDLHDADDKDVGGES